MRHYRASFNAASIALNASREEFFAVFYTCNYYNIRVTSIEMVLLSIIFYTNQIHGGIISRLFFIHFVAPCVTTMVKEHFTFSVYEDLSTLALHTSVGCISLQNASRTALCYATNTIK